MRARIWKIGICGEDKTNTFYRCILMKENYLWFRRNMTFGKNPTSCSWLSLHLCIRFSSKTNSLWRNFPPSESDCVIKVETFPPVRVTEDRISYDYTPNGGLVLVLFRHYTLFQFGFIFFSTYVDGGNP